MEGDEVVAEGNWKAVYCDVESGNWRVTFRFNGTDAEIVNYEDYH